MEITLVRSLSITGWMSEPELRFLAEIASKSKEILEVGSYRGRSTRAMADHTTGSITCVDPWDGNYQCYAGQIHYNGDDTDFSYFHFNLAEHIKSGRVRFRRGKFTELMMWDHTFDFIFLDAIHEYDALKADINKALPLLAPGGILAGHDYCDGWPGVKQCVDELYPNKKIVESIWTIQI